VVFGLTGPIWVDADGDGTFTSARAYAEQLVAAHAAFPALFDALAEHDPTVAAHAAELLDDRGVDLASEAVRAALANAAAPVRDGFRRYVDGR
jgi:hypothetical protein